ncbi:MULTISPECIES: RNA polymerase sigma factor SigF [Streptomyces]|uniref:RNA polymerase sigma factor SigF n=1 Tax=Streptomyces sudanensis TaxID=436397 RepID=A0ABY4TGM4_9ACTN|nr:MULTISPECIES: RNA polymerase sigma factor SigF [Streptomyces]URN18054.1 RNA polymerase sigma factor SigF [Streptomyces sudanensis]
MPTATTTPTETTAAAAALPRIPDPTGVAPQDAKELSKQFFARLAALEEGTGEYQYVRNTLIELNLSLVRYAAARFRSRADQMEDIVQVGTIGLIKAIDRFELSREVEFATFAMPCVIGEIKRFFRDTSWSVHVPRRLQELRIDIARATDELFQELDRSPTAAELADRLGVGEDEVIEGLVAANGYTAASLDMPLDDSGEPASATLADLVGEEDRDMRLTEDVQALKPIVERLDDRDRAILRMRFVEELTQAEIGRRLGVSQMHVSRLLTRMTARMREGLLGEN